MAEQTIPRIVIAGASSGVGKTTLVTGMLAAWKARGLKVQSYKVGPDYIDPGYHTLASGRSAHNLDSWLMPADKLYDLFVSTAAGHDLVLIEGVMGLYDGGRNGISSTAAIAKLLKAPVLLVMNAKAMGESAAALALGYKLYDPEVDFAGVLVNRLGSDSHRAIVAEALASRGLPMLGGLLCHDVLKMPERHLGLTPVDECDAQLFVKNMGETVSREIDLDGLLAVARKAPPLERKETATSIITPRVRMGVAEDEAFSFYYAESLAVLEERGVELVRFSPLHDAALPAVHGLLFGGGFPEMFAEKLAANQAMRLAVSRAAKQGMPVYAECGGLMYLTERLVDFNGQAYDMAGVIPAECRMQEKLQTVGYVEAKALGDTVLCAKEARLRGHEFHFSRMVPLMPEEDFPWAFTFTKNRTGDCYRGGYAQGQVLASYLHMHFCGHEDAAEQFIRACERWKGVG